MKTTRRYDIDWIRVLVFDLLIIYHVGMFFVKDWDWHLKNNVEIDWLTLPMMFSSLWRLPILFVVSGMGTYFALGNRSKTDYLKERFTRLMIPLIVGVFIVVVPQVYWERLSDGSFVGTYWEFYPHFFSGIYPKGNFTWNHLWFLPYLFFMSVIGLPLFMVIKKQTLKIITVCIHFLDRYRLGLYVFVIPLILIEYTLEPLFPITRALYNDVYAFTHYFICFISGFFLVVTGKVFWQKVKSLRYFSLNVGIGLFMIFGLFMEELLVSPLLPGLKIICMWSIILAIFGFAARYLNNESNTVKKRNKAVYPFYIIHQTITVALGNLLMNHPVHYGWKFLLMVIGTFGGSRVFYTIVRKYWILHPLFGLKDGRTTPKKSNL